MNAKEVTHKDVIDYVLKYYQRNGDHDYMVHGSKLHITGHVSFSDFKFSALPKGMVFTNSCDLDTSCITSIPDDIILNRSLFLDKTGNLCVPAIYIKQNLYTVDSNAKLSSGTYVGGAMYTVRSPYWYLDDLDIHGYIVNTPSTSSTGSLFGILS